MPHAYQRFVRYLQDQTRITDQELHNFLQQFTDLPEGITANMTFYVLNLISQEFEFISPSAAAVLGFPDEVFMKEGPDKLQATLCPQDARILYHDLIPKMREAVMKLEGSERKLAIFEYEYRLRRPGDKVVYCSEQASYAKFDEAHNPILLTGYYKLLNPEKRFNGVKATVWLNRPTGMEILFSEAVNGHKLNLTPRQLQIAKLVAEGNTTAAIAQKLNITEHTVSTHRRDIKGKLGVGNVSELVRLLLEYGIPLKQQ